MVSDGVVLLFLLWENAIALMMILLALTDS